MQANNIMCNHMKKCGVKTKYAIVFASTQLRIIRLCKYTIDSKAYQELWIFCKTLYKPLFLFALHLVDMSIQLLYSSWPWLSPLLLLA